MTGAMGSMLFFMTCIINENIEADMDNVKRERNSIKLKKCSDKAKAVKKLISDIELSIKEQKAKINSL